MNLLAGLFLFFLGVLLGYFVADWKLRYFRDCMADDVSDHIRNAVRYAGLTRWQEHRFMSAFRDTLYVRMKIRQEEREKASGGY